MMVDRDQTRRDVLRKTYHVLFNCECRHEQTAHEAVKELDALLSELEQAERTKREDDRMYDDLSKMLDAAEARLAKVPALVEALRRLHNEVDCRIEHGAESGGHLDYVRAALADALAVWEQE